VTIFDEMLRRTHDGARAERELIATAGAIVDNVARKRPRSAQMAGFQRSGIRPRWSKWP